MNTAARMESNGRPGHIHLSSTTASLLIEAGKEKWIVPREDLIHPKGKGEMQTYWLSLSSNSGSARGSSIHNCDVESTDESAIDTQFPELQNPETDRMVRWMTNLMFEQLQQLHTYEPVRGSPSLIPRQTQTNGDENMPLNAIEEIQDVLPVLPFELAQVEQRRELSTVVRDELADFVLTLSCLYQKHPFHNFSHAVQVSMSVVKLLSFATEASSDPLNQRFVKVANDPLIHLACTFAALIQ